MHRKDALFIYLFLVGEHISRRYENLDDEASIASYHLFSSPGRRRIFNNINPQKGNLIPRKQQETETPMNEGQNLHVGTSLGLQIDMQVISFHFLTGKMETETVTPTAVGRY